MSKMQIRNRKVELKNKRICRFCSSQTEPLTNIFSRKDKQKGYSDLATQAMAFFSIRITQDDELPKTVCNKCRAIINSCYRFQKICSYTDTALKQYPSTGVWPRPLDVSTINEETVFEHRDNLCRKPNQPAEPIPPVEKSSTPKRRAVSSPSKADLFQKKSVKTNNEYAPILSEPVIQKDFIKQDILEKSLAPDTSRIYQFKIILIGPKPKIWRCVQVPGEYSFLDLHVVIQNVMGWHQLELHKFQIVNSKTGKGVLIGSPDKLKITGTIPESNAKIAEYFFCFKDKAIYTYDFDCNWEHSVFLEGILPVIKGTQYPKCIDGRMACPPEGVGGASEYIKFMKVLANPRDKIIRYLIYMKWLNLTGQSNFNPQNFDPKSVVFSMVSEFV